jgi:glutaredoxin
MRIGSLIGALPLLLAAARMGLAQETVGPKPEAQEVRRYFDRPIDYWKTGGRKDKPASASDGEPRPVPGRIEIRENVWAQPIKTPDGSWAIYVPPPAILNFLEHPTEESAKAYLAWKKEQAEKMNLAIALLARVREETGREKSDETGEAAQREPKAEASSTPFQITYFHQKQCPHCTAEDAVLAEWLKKHPEAKIDLVERGNRPELWKEKEIRGTPTMILADPESGKSETLVGFRTLEALEVGLSRLRLKRPEGPERVRTSKEKSE